MVADDSTGLTGVRPWEWGAVILNALVSAGFSLAGLWGVWGASDAARVFAMYAAARSLPLLVVAFWFGLAGSRPGLAGLALVLTLVQASDVLVGIAQHDLGKTLGPAALSILTAFAARSLSQPR